MNDLVILKGKEVVCDSLEVAERFHKRHDKLISEIERMYGDLIDKGCAQNGGHPLFTRTTYVHLQNKQTYPKFYMNRDGFSLLVMGFTGVEAMKWKLDYIKAFNAMEKLIYEQQSIEWKFFRQQGKMVRLSETDTLKELAEFAKVRGSTNYNKIYSNYTRLANKTVGIKSIKDATTMQLNYLMLVENILIQIIRSGMETDKDYRDIYQDCKDKAIQLSNTVSIGVTA